MSSFLATKEEGIAANKQDSEGPEKEAEGMTKGGKGWNTLPWLARY